MQKPIVPPSASLAVSIANVFNNRPRIAVIGLRTTTKLPAGKWKDVIEGNLFTDAELKGLWHEYNGRLNIGIACGKPSQIVVVDADNQAAVEWVEANLPFTPMRVKTKKGMHFYYRLADDVDQRNRTDILGSKKKWEHDAQQAGFDVRSHHYSDPDAQKTENERVKQAMKAAWDAGIHVGAIIDVRGTGGQVVGPYSKKDDGFEYTMVEPWTPALFAQVPFWNPEWVNEDLKWKRPSRGVVSIAKLGAKSTDEDREKRIANFTDNEKYRRAKGWLERTPGAVSEQRGHDHTFYVACRLCNGFDIGPEATLELMLQWNNSCQPPWTEQELVHKVGDAMKHSGPGNGAMLEDRSDWLASQKVEPLVAFVAAEPTTSRDPAASDTGPEGNVPHPRPTTALPPTNDDARKLLKALWARLGVDYADIERCGVQFQIARSPGGGKNTQVLPPVLNNIVAVLKFSERFHRRHFWRNELKATSHDGDRVVDDSYILALRADLDMMFGGRTQVGRDLAYDAITLVAQENVVDPCARWLTSLTPWDGMDRLARLPAEILGAEDSRTNRDQFRHFIISLVARILRPGSKVDTCLFLVGKQGRKKSQFFRLLIDGHRSGGQWFSDRHVEMKDKDSQMFIATHHLVEWSEAEHAKSAAMVDRVKSFLSQQDDVFRPPYGHSMLTRPRRCVFCATSNDNSLIHDATGARRFYVIRVEKRIDLAKLLSWRTQLFAQALALYRGHVDAEGRARAAHPHDPGAAEESMTGDPAFVAGRWWFDEEEEAGREEHLTEYRAVSPFEDKVRAWVEALYREREERVQLVREERATSMAFTIGELMEDALDLRPGQANNVIIAQVRAALLGVGCTEHDPNKPTRIQGRRGTGRYWLLPATMDVEGSHRGPDPTIYDDDDPPWSACDDDSA